MNGLSKLTPFLTCGMECLGLFFGEIKGFPEVWLRCWLLLAGLWAAGHTSLWLIPTTLLGLASAAASALVGTAKWFPGGLTILLSLRLTLISQGVGRAPVALAASLTPAAGFLALLRVDDGDERGAGERGDEDVLSESVFHDLFLPFYLNGRIWESCGYS